MLSLVEDDEKIRERKEDPACRNQGRASGIAVKTGPRPFLPRAGTPFVLLVKKSDVMVCNSLCVRERMVDVHAMETRGVPAR